MTAGLSVVLLALGLTVVLPPVVAAAATCTGNQIVCENELPGTPQDQWDIEGSGDDSIQGFATQISVNHGETVQFKIKTDASNYSIQIFRLGYYQGNGARKVADVTPSAHLPQNQPACASDPATEIYDCGTWAVSASWAVPATAVSGVYVALLNRPDKNESSHIPFIVRDDSSHSQVVFQTSDPTWQAYNTYGVSDFYQGLANGRAYKVSYNRPIATRNNNDGRDFLFSNEYPMLRFMEQNGYDISYISGLDTDIRGNLLTNHRAFVSVGHDEYWSAGQRTNVENARDAGVNLAFFSGNEVYWKTRWEPSEDGSSTANRTLVCYKDTWANAQSGPGVPLDPVTPTPTWRDPRFGDLGHGPENALTGTLYMSNNTDLAITVSSAEGQMRLWRNTSLAAPNAPASTTLAPHTVGYESDEDLDNGFRPAGLIDLSTTTGPTPQYLRDFGNTVTPGTTTHHLTEYRAPSGALVFGAGTIQWAWGVDENHDGTVSPVDVRMQQATINVLADMGASATTVISGLTAATKSTDTTPPTAVITSPAAGSTISQGSTVVVSGTASDVGGKVAGVEVSVDGGISFHPAAGRATYSYTGILTGKGPGAIQVRAIDDSANMQSVPTAIAINSDCPCSIFGESVPNTPSVSDTGAVTLGVNFTSSADGFITGLRFYKGSGNTGTHVGTLYKADGTVLSSVTFTNESATGWQTASFASAVPIAAGIKYVAAYTAPNGGYPADSEYFAYTGKTTGTLTALGGQANGNGVYGWGTGMPTQDFMQTNYYVDVLYSQTDTTPVTVTGTDPLDGATSVPTTATPTGVFSRDVQPASVGFTVKDPQNTSVPGTVSYDSATRTATFTPQAPLGKGVKYTASLTASADGVGAMTTPAVWSFTTAQPDPDPGVCPCSMFKDSDSPAVVAANDPNSVELGMAFTADTAGAITGVKFYKGPGNAGTHTISLWDSNGTLLATAPVGTESTSGWQAANFSSEVQITAGTTYIASYRAPVGRYSYTANSLGTALDKPPLHTPANAGRYTYGSGAPVNASSANYFVDPVFAESAGVPPAVIATTPDPTGHAQPDALITATFDRRIQPPSLVMTVTDANNNPVAGTTSYDAPSATATFQPSASLALGTSFTASVSASSSAGTAMPAPKTWNFSTVAAPPAGDPYSLYAATDVPATAAWPDNGPVTVGMKFASSRPGSVTAVKFFAGPGNNGPYRVDIWAADGTKLGSGQAFGNASGWKTVILDTPVTITAGATYVASYRSASGHYAETSGGLANGKVTGPLQIPAGGGTYSYPDGFPAGATGTDFAVDVVAVLQSAAPTAPSVTTTAPDGSVPAQPDALVTTTFNQDVEPSSIVMTIKDPGNNVVAGSTTYDPSTFTATFQPSAALALGTSFTASVTATSTAGLAMPSATTWTFATVAAPPPGDTSSLYGPTDTPANAAADDNGPVSVGMKFIAARPGSVTAIKFYVGAGNQGPYVASLWGPDGTIIGTGHAFGNAPTNSWKTVLLDAPVAINADTTYVASYRSAGGHYSYTANGLSNGKTTGPLQIPSGGGLYSYPDGFPTSSTGTDFAVDVVAVLQSQAPPTPPPPTVTTTPSGSSLVQPDAVITASFDRDIDPSTLAMTVSTTSGTPVPGTASYDAQTKTATFTQASPLPFGTSFIASVNATSADGAAMTSPQTWNFTSVAQPAVGTQHTLFAPTDVPANGSWNDNGPVTVGVSFTTDQPGSVTAIRFYVGPGNSGPWTVDLWDASSGARIGGGQATGSASGWKTVILDTSVPIQVGGTYIASYRGATGHYAMTGNGLAAARDATPLHSPTDAGAYSYPAEFPSSATSTDFGVDVVFVG